MEKNKLPLAHEILKFRAPTRDAPYVWLREGTLNRGWFDQALTAMRSCTWYPYLAPVLGTRTLHPHLAPAIRSFYAGLNLIGVFFSHYMRQ